MEFDFNKTSARETYNLINGLVTSLSPEGILNAAPFSAYNYLCMNPPIIYIDPKGPYVIAEDLHTIGRMNGTGNYVRTRNAFFKIDRISQEQFSKE